MPVDFLPDVILLGSFPLSIMVLTGLGGLGLAYLLIALKARRYNGPGHRAQELLLDLAVSSIIGAKLFYVALDPLGHLRNPLLLVIFPYGPWVLPAGLSAGLLYTAWRLRRTADPLAVLDLAIGPLALGLAVGLLGWKAPGTWAFPLLVGLAAVIGLVRKPGEHAGTLFGETLVILCCALVLADLPRPVYGWGGITVTQGLATLAGTLSWVWVGRRNTSFSAVRRN